MAHSRLPIAENPGIGAERVYYICKCILSSLSDRRHVLLMFFFYFVFSWFFSPAESSQECRRIERGQSPAIAPWMSLGVIERNLFHLLTILRYRI